MPMTITTRARQHPRVGRPRDASVSTQRGMASLALTLTLLLIAGLVLLHAHRHMVFDHRTSGHTERAHRAFALAESGLAWARTRLNDTTLIDPTSGTGCASSTTATARRFRAWYAPEVIVGSGLARNMQVPPDSKVACTIASDGTPSCRCPVPGQPPGIDTQLGEGFVVEFAAVPEDPEALRVTATGCVHAPQDCGSHAGGMGQSLDARAQVSMMFKRVPRLAAVPRAAATTGGEAALCGGLTLENLDAASGGFVVHAGGAVRLGAPPSCAFAAAPVLRSAVGVDVLTAMAARDPALASHAGTAEGYALTWLGTPLDAYAQQACVITARDAQERGAALVQATTRASRPCRWIWLDGPADVPAGSVIGIAPSDRHPGDPVLIVTASPLRIGAGARVHGLIHLDGSATDPLQPGASIVGALVARGAIRLSGGAVQLDRRVLSELAASGHYMKVPASWRDD